MFLALDANGDGHLSFDEIRAGLLTLNLKNKDAVLDVLMAADTDCSGAVDYTEFIAATLESHQFMKEKYMRAAFSMLDINGNGLIDFDEVA